MTNAKHTPGPWTAGNELNSERPGSVPVVALVRDSLGGRMHVAFVNGKAGEQEANAALIAAAPDLLAALRALLPLAERGRASVLSESSDEERPGHADGFDATLEAARAALARATGGAK